MLGGGGHRLGGGGGSGPRRPTTVALVVAVFVFLTVLFESIVIVPVGSLGVVSVLGSVQETPLEAGLHVVTPFVSVVSEMSVRLKVLHFADDVPTAEGVNVHLAASCINRLDPAKAVDMYRRVGVDFETKILLPEFQSVIRAVTSAHSSQELYTAAARTTMSRDLKLGIQRLVRERGIVVETTLINKLLLPSALEYAIEKKMAMEQQSEQMQYVLQKERLLAEQQIILARGIAKFQSIVSEGVTEKLLRWKGIEATKSLVDSCNPKLVVIGTGSGHTQLLLNQEMQAADGAHRTPVKATVLDPMGFTDPLRSNTTLG